MVVVGYPWRGGEIGRESGHSPVQTHDVREETSDGDRNKLRERAYARLFYVGSSVVESNEGWDGRDIPHRQIRTRASGLAVMRRPRGPFGARSLRSITIPSLTPRRAARQLRQPSTQDSVCLRMRAAICGSCGPLSGPAHADPLTPPKCTSPIAFVLPRLLLGTVEVYFVFGNYRSNQRTMGGGSVR